MSDNNIRNVELEASGQASTSSGEEREPKVLSTQNSVQGTPTEGKIAREIGTGDAAKDSFIYLTIKWSFLLGALTTAALFAKTFFDCDVGAMSGLDLIKGVWSVFMPIITLALGYAFGKGR